ncbi:pseudomonapepsin [Alicyclobacillus hesperidum subsp. aegles]|uniref:S53 family peptidase n=1 Tax=Alicyclobacillus hesperidum TaxID=89784 RepID=UPI0002E74127|nr:S53 family peptidase [Alicyclobacillus hesperidum]GLG00156.1 pseudomonapepsin [Alicyclobacillus hesperidum subsp. aegles]
MQISVRILAATTACLLTGGVPLVAMAATAPMAKRVVVASVEPQAKHGARIVGELAGNAPMHVAIGLKLRNQAALQQLIGELYNPSSKQYGHYLTPQQFRQEFAPSASEVEAVSTYLRQYGLKVQSDSHNNLVLDVKGTATQMEHAFSIHEHQYQEGSFDFYAPSQMGTLPASIAEYVSGVVGLGEEPMTGHLTVTKRSASATGGYTPAQIQTAYDYKRLYSSWAGRGQTIAIVTSGSVNVSDVDAFDSAFGLPNPLIRQRVIDGTSTAPGDETTLDCEWSHAIAPTASLAVYEAATPDAAAFIDAFNQVASDDGAHVVTTSWGAPESQTPSSTIDAEHSIFEEMAAQGQSVFAAAGDSGSSDGLAGNHVDYPSSDPYVTACGGTTLDIASDGERLSESAWTDGGGGQSAIFGQPSWQYGPGVPETGARQTADIALNANPATGYDFYYEGTWEIAGGTSFVAPEMAATFALIDQSRALKGKPPVGLADIGIYAMARNASYRNFAFHDVTSGNNGAYAAGVGYDHPTGWGSIDAYYFVHGLNG